MKKILLLSAALVAALTAPALAQREGRGDGPRATQGQQYPNRSGREGGQRGPQAAPQSQQQAQPRYDRGNDGGVTRADELPQFQQRAPQAQAQRNDNRGNFNRGGNDNRRPDFNRGGNDNRFDGRNNFNNGRPGYNDNRGWNNRPGYDNRRFSQYYRNWNSQNRFRAGVYYRPQGFSYRRWSYGDILPSVFWGSRYWLNNYYSYDLPPPPPGTIWVRYGDDALLIDRYSGEVIQVSYSVFW